MITKRKDENNTTMRIKKFSQIHPGETFIRLEIYNKAVLYMFEPPICMKTNDNPNSDHNAIVLKFTIGSNIEIKVEENEDIIMVNSKTVWDYDYVEYMR